MAAEQREEIGVSRFGILAAVLARGYDPRGRLPDSPLLEGFDADRNLLIPSNATPSRRIGLRPPVRRTGLVQRLLHLRFWELRDVKAS